MLLGSVLLIQHPDNSIVETKATLPAETANTRRFFLDKAEIGSSLGWWIADETHIHIWTGSADQEYFANKISDTLWYYDVPNAVLNNNNAGFRFYVYNRGSNQNQMLWVGAADVRDGTNYFRLKNYSGSTYQERDFETVNWKDTKTIYVKVDAASGWSTTSAPYVHYYQESKDSASAPIHTINNVFAGGWPGVQATASSKFAGLFEVEVPILNDMYLSKVIFHNNAGGTTNQTPNINNVIYDHAYAIVGSGAAGQNKSVSWEPLPMTSDYVRFFVNRNVWSDSTHITKFHYWSSTVDREVFPTTYLHNAADDIWYVVFDIPHAAIHESSFTYQFKRYNADGAFQVATMEMTYQTFGAINNNLIHVINSNTANSTVFLGAASATSDAFLVKVLEAYFTCDSDVHNGYGDYGTVNTTYLYQEGSGTPKFTGSLQEEFYDYPETHTNYLQVRGTSYLVSLQEKHDAMWGMYTNAASQISLIMNEENTAIVITVIAASLASSLAVSFFVFRRKRLI